jgi:hypothetical protein
MRWQIIEETPLILLKSPGKLFTGPEKGLIIPLQYDNIIKCSEL